MKGPYIYFLVLLALLLFACSRPMQLSSAIHDASSIYNAASAKHYQLAHGQIPSTDPEWVALIEEFQRAINADAEGEWADSAHYAIASCWMWLGQSTEQPSIDNAIGAFKKLLQDYPNSAHAAEAHYWLGDCYDRLGDYGRAVTHYQTVISHYLDHPIADKAQLRLGRSYERQYYFTLARITYEALSQRSQAPQIVAQAKKQVLRLQAKQTVASTRADSPPEIVPLESPQVAQPNPSKIPLEMIKPSPELPKMPQPSTKAAPIQPPHADGKTVTALSPIEPSSEPPKTPKPVADPSLVQQLGLGVKTIVIDPGHGGKDPGAVSRMGQEKRIVLSLSKMLREILVEKGYHVRLTRKTDVYIPLKKRTQFATKQEADLFISIHANASTARDAAGIETYYLALASDESAQSTAMRENVGAKYSMKELDTLVGKILKESKSTESRRLAQFIQEQLTSAKQAKDRGVKHAPFVVLIGTKVPAVLVEVGFISNSNEGKKLTTKAYQRQLATAIAEGVKQYVRSIPLAVANQP